MSRIAGLGSTRSSGGTHTGPREPPRIRVCGNRRHRRHLPSTETKQSPPQSGGEHPPRSTHPHTSAPTSTTLPYNRFSIYLHKQLFDCTIIRLFIYRGGHLGCVRRGGRPRRLPGRTRLAAGKSRLPSRTSGRRPMRDAHMYVEYIRGRSEAFSITRRNLRRRFSRPRDGAAFAPPRIARRGWWRSRGMGHRTAPLPKRLFV